MWSSFFEKIKNQSTLIVIALGAYSFYALKNASNLTNPLTITGLLAFLLAMILIIFNFFIIQIVEYYQSLIDDLKSIISSFKTQQKFADKRYKDLATETTTSLKNEVTKGYKPVTETETENFNIED